MNLKKLKIAEADFFNRYPGGFQNPDIMAIGKKHKMDAMTAFAQESFTKAAFKNSQKLLDNWIKLISRSSMISLFEKPKFRDYAYSLSEMDRKTLVEGLKQWLHGNAQKGFEQISKILQEAQLAKWSLITACPAYFNPTHDVFIKPTTAKGVLSHFEVTTIIYHSTPTWAFYEAYKDLIIHMKTHVSPELSPSNAAFSGFLMMSLPQEKSLT